MVKPLVRLRERGHISQNRITARFGRRSAENVKNQQGGHLLILQFAIRRASLERGTLQAHRELAQNPQAAAL